MVFFMGNGNEILDMYIYETNTLLEQLENIVLEAEKVDTFSQDNVNEIFRIMHTIKGSSAMMEFSTLTTIAHRIEDLFFIIRENTMEVVSEANRPALFDLVFQSIDYFRGEVEKVEANQPLDEDIDSFLSNVNSLISKIKGEEAEEPAPQPAAAEPPPAETGAPAPSAAPDFPPGDKNFPYGVRVFFDEGCGMESLRSFMLVASVRDFCAESDFIFSPADVEQNPATSEIVVEQGFLMMFSIQRIGKPLFPSSNPPALCASTSPLIITLPSRNPSPKLPLRRLSLSPSPPLPRRPLSLRRPPAVRSIRKRR